MNIVDFSGWLAYFADEVQAEAFAAPIQDTEKLLVPSIVLFEVVKRLLQQRGEDEALQAAAHMQEGRVVDLDSAIALSAAEISRELKLPLADSVILATARAYNAVLWTMDKDFAGIDGVRYFPSRGRKGRGPRTQN